MLQPPIEFPSLHQLDPAAPHVFLADPSSLWSSPCHINSPPWPLETNRTLSSPPCTSPGVAAPAQPATHPRSTNQPPGNQQHQPSPEIPLVAAVARQDSRVLQQTSATARDGDTASSSGEQSPRCECFSLPLSLFIK